MSKKSARKERAAARVQAPTPRKPSRGGSRPAGGVPRSWLYAGLAGLVVVIVVVVVLVSALGGGDDGGEVMAVDGSQTAALLAGIPQDGQVLGSPDAKVTLVEYADLRCPFCQEWSLAVFPTLVQQYVSKGDLRIEFRGITLLGPASEKPLRAVYAAAEQNHLWDYVDLLYQNQGSENEDWVTDDLLRAIGAAIPGFDTNAMLTGMDSDAVTSLIAKVRDEAQAHQVQGTPTFWIGPTGGDLKRLEIKSLTVDQFTPAIDQLLGR